MELDREARFYKSGRISKPGDGRSPFRRDRDRILYASAFRRLSGITQVVAANDLLPIHNRLTHSLEVAQIGRSIAEALLRDRANDAYLDQLGGLDPDVVEAACLAHDLGHPPFGHVAEAELNLRVKRFNENGFEGNAQTFRLLTRLSVRESEQPGLNLTRATLRAVLKYPWLKGPTDVTSHKWGAYSTEEDVLNWARQNSPVSPTHRCLEAEIMDWADDVAYAVHDVEDFYRSGLIPLEVLSQNPVERRRIVEHEANRVRALGNVGIESLTRTLGDVLGFAPIVGPFRGGHQDRALLRNFTSSLVDRYVRAAAIGDDANGRLTFLINPEFRQEVAMLKGLTWQYVIESRTLITQRYGHKRLIGELFEMFFDAGRTGHDIRIFPESFREAIGDQVNEADLARTVADLIASLTESQAVALHNRLTGVSLGAPLDPIVP